MRKILKLLSSRLLLVVALIAFQVWLIVSWFYNVTISNALMPALEALALVLAICVINRREDPSYKLGWCVLILALPAFGVPMYLLCVGRKMPKKLADGTTHANARMTKLLAQEPAILEKLEQRDSDTLPIFENGVRSSNFPVYENTAETYFASGEEWAPVFLEQLRRAKHFIFIEIFIIDYGTLWDQVLAILKEKVQEGVEVKVIYDDMGCITLPRHFARQLNEMGIETYVFNRLRPMLVIQMNNRDHRKICVIDNNVGFTGGVNLADEYINKKKRFGYWRDSALMIQGDAVWSLTVMFLGMYTFLKKDDEGIDYSRYHLPPQPPADPHGYYQPFSDTPTDEAVTGLNIHLNLVVHAKKYVYVDTPYLILPGDMMKALCLAADNGVDVRILTPHIPDKWIAFSMTRGNYAELIEHGVKIYEFTPGFNHTKNMVSDDIRGVVGSVNTDYRSYYLHFENGILFEDKKLAVEMRESFEKSLRQAHLVTLAEARKANILIRCFRAMANVFTPLF